MPKAAGVWQASPACATGTCDKKGHRERKTHPPLLQGKALPPPGSAQQGDLWPGSQAEQRVLSRQPPPCSALSRLLHASRAPSRAGSCAHQAREQLLRRLWPSPLLSA